VQTGIVIEGFVAIGLATGGLGDVAALAPSGDYLGTARLAIGGSGIFAAGESSALDSGVTDGVTNEEATWDWLGPPQAMTPRDQGDLSAYIGKMSQQYVSERDGSLTGERLATLEAVRNVEVDNVNLADHTISEDKVGRVDEVNVSVKLDRLDWVINGYGSGPGSFNFFLSPGGGVGTTDEAYSSILSMGYSVVKYDFEWRRSFQVTMANPPFQVDGPPYPTNLPFYQTEALSWLKHNKDESLASQAGEVSIETVKKLYAAGATRVDVVVTFSQPGDGNASELEVTFPREDVKELLAVMRSLHPSNWEMDLDKGEDPYADDGSFAGQAVTLSWD